MIFQIEIFNLLVDYWIYLLISFLISLVISFFYLNWDDRSQLIDNKIKLELILTVPSLIYVTISFFFSLRNLLQDIFIILVITLICSFIVKSYIFRKMEFEKLSEINQLEVGRELLKVEDLKVYYPLLGGVLKRQIGDVKAVDGINFEIKTGETLGLVGESGCGKSTVARAILNLVEKNQGTINFDGTPIPENYSSYFRQKIQMVFQDPDASLNPRLKVIDIISEPLKNLLGITNKAELRKIVLRLMEEVSLKREHLDRYPHEFSGGQKQRIVIARALASNPELIILDEPTSALDVSVQAQILNLLKNLQIKYGYGYLFITHNLSVVNHIADRVAVMYLGRFVEIGSVDQIFNNPTHPYTQALLASRSEIDPYNDEIKFIIPFRLCV